MRYSSSDPTATFVDGDNDFAGIIVWLVIFAVVGLWKLLMRDESLPKAPGRFSSPASSSAPEPGWNAAPSRR